MVTRYLIKDLASHTTTGVAGLPKGVMFVELRGGF